MIPQAFIDDLLSRVDVVDVVGKHVKLRKAGANMLGLCPFHGEKTPSFTVSPSKQFYHCFGCQANGSAIGFLMAFAGLGYVEAIEELAASVGLTVPRETRPGDAHRARVAPNLIEQLTLAARFYQRRLRESQPAIQYLKGRGLSGQTAGRFGLGYAPAGWRNLEAAVADYDDESLVTAGLVSTGRQDENNDSRRNKRYDRFRDRVMFPIRNMRGGIIGFGGRVLDNGEPKYLNSPETPVFSKGRELYGLFESREAMRALDQAIVVEGYMDVLMLAEHGIGNAVATLGTATTTDHVRKLLRTVDSLVFSFDGDKAGRKAAWRAMQACLPVVGDTQRVSFLFLPDGVDPDSFVSEQGPAAWNRAIDNAEPLSAFMLRHLSADKDMNTPEGRAAFAADARSLLQSLQAPGLKMQMMRAVAEHAQIGMLELEQYLAPTADERRRAERRSQQPPTPERAATRRPAARQMPVRAGLPTLDRRLRLLFVCHPGLVGLTDPPQAGQELLSPELRRWADAMHTLAPDASMAARLDQLRELDLPGLGELQRDLATDWGGVTQLSEAEAGAEVRGALDRFASQLRARAAADLAKSGLSDDAARQQLRDLVASRKES